MSELNIKPLADRVVIEPTPLEETKTASGIIIPVSVQEEFTKNQGTIVAVGPGKKDEPMTVKIGDKVIYGKYGDSKLKLEGKDYIIMREADILAII